MKIAICKDHKHVSVDGEVMLTSFKYNWNFRLFGPGYSTLLACSYNRSDLVNKTIREIKGNYEIIDILEI